jgi:acetyltransferase-like isoleucine patch superfamily enzyme
MSQPKMGRGVVVGFNVKFGREVVIWNYVVIGDNSRIGDGSCIGSFCDIGKNVSIGKNCNIQSHVTISNGCSLGDNVFIAPNCSLLNDKYPKSSSLAPSKIRDNVIVGGGTIILPNVIVGENSVIGGGSVVTRDVPARKVVAGSPAKQVMTLEDYETKRNDFTFSKSKVTS